jgi:hypothetical protein
MGALEANPGTFSSSQGKTFLARAFCGIIERLEMYPKKKGLLFQIPTGSGSDSNPPKTLEFPIEEIRLTERDGLDLVGHITHETHAALDAQMHKAPPSRIQRLIVNTLEPGQNRRQAVLNEYGLLTLLQQSYEEDWLIRMDPMERIIGRRGEDEGDGYNPFNRIRFCGKSWRKIKRDSLLRINNMVRFENLPSIGLLRLLRQIEALALEVLSRHQSK